MTLRELAYQVSFNTPAFLGNAEQQAQWRTPPFKALLRQCWRVVKAPQLDRPFNVDELRTAENLLFGAASDDGAEKSHRSLVRLRLTKDMDEYDHLTDSQWDLYDRMSRISEDCYCAGWIGGNEYDIWNALQHGDPSPAHRRMSPRLLRRCQVLSVEIGGWIYWANGPQFVPMPQWLALADKRPKLAAATKE